MAIGILVGFGSMWSGLKKISNGKNKQTWFPQWWIVQFCSLLPQPGLLAWQLCWQGSLCGVCHTPLIVFWPKILSLLKNGLFFPTFLVGGSARGWCLHSFPLNFLFRKRFINFSLTHQCPWLLLAANLRHLLACRFWMNVRARVCSVQGEVASGQCNPALCASNASSFAVLTCSRCTDSS